LISRRAKIERRNKHGASILLVIAFAFTLVVCLYGTFQLIMLLGGSDELRNGVDAAALNVSKRAIEVKTPPTPDFADCADTSGGISLANINRVWGKTCLINANVEAMTAEGLGTGQASGNADNAYVSAQQINDQLLSQLTSKFTLGRNFNQLAGNRSVKMLGGDAQITSSFDSQWPTALLNRGSQSNISFSNNQIPPGTTSKINAIVQGKNTYMQGYAPFTVNNKMLCFVPFANNEMPHLISTTAFQTNRSDINPVPGAINPIPNAFSGSGKSNAGASAGASPLSAVSYAIANPQRQYNLAIPYSFLLIQINNTANWYVNNKKVNETVYGLAPETQWGAKNSKLPCGGTLNGYASLGNEYKVATLWQVFTSLSGDPTPVLLKLLQRIQEIKPDYSIGELQGLLQKQTLMAAQNKYIIYPAYQNADETNPSIQIVADNGVLPPWLQKALRAEGMMAPVVTETAQRDFPNYDWQEIIPGNKGQKCTPGEHYAELSGVLSWQPGSGYTQCLGELRIQHTTDCFFSAN
jgi:Flp pilus assembly protein TadG